MATWKHNGKNEFFSTGTPFIGTVRHMGWWKWRWRTYENHDGAVIEEGYCRTAASARGQVQWRYQIYLTNRRKGA